MSSPKVSPQCHRLLLLAFDTAASFIPDRTTCDLHPILFSVFSNQPVSDGRDEGRLAALAERLNLDYVAFNLDNLSQMTQIVRDYDLVFQIDIVPNVFVRMKSSLTRISALNC